MAAGEPPALTLTTATPRHEADQRISVGVDRENPRGSSSWTNCRLSLASSIARSSSVALPMPTVFDWQLGHSSSSSRQASSGRVISMPSYSTVVHRSSGHSPDGATTFVDIQQAIRMRDVASGSICQVVKNCAVSTTSRRGAVFESCLHILPTETYRNAKRLQRLDDRILCVCATRISQHC